MKRLLAFIEDNWDAIGIAAGLLTLLVMERITAWNPPL